MKKHPNPAGRNSRPAIRPARVKLASAIDMRKIRAYIVAALYLIISMDRGVFQVSRPDGSATYKVEVREGFHSCSCGDAQKRRGAWCKHALAIVILLAFFGEAVKSWETPYEIPLDKRPDVPPEAEAAYYEGARRRKPIVLPFPKGSREATRRNRARIEMPTRCVELLWMLCRKAIRSQVVAPTAKKPLGRRGAPTVIRLFFTVFRVLRNATYEKAKEELVKHLGTTVTIDGAAPNNPSKNCYAKYIHDPALTPLLEECLRLTARVVRKIEKAIVIDATAFSTCQTENWLDSNYGKKVRRKHNIWLKAHTASGAVTDIVAALLTSTNLNTGSADVNFFERLLDIAKTTWNMKWVLADKAYLSNENILAAAARNMTAIIPIKVNWKQGKSPEARSLIEFHKHEAAFDEIYRYRTKIESVFSAIKRTCGYHARTRFLDADQVKTQQDAQHVGTGRRNELLAKFAAHNLRRLVWLEHRHNDTVDFDADRAFEPLPFERDGDNPFDAAA